MEILDLDFIKLILLVSAYHAREYVYRPLLGELAATQEEFSDYARVMAGGYDEVIEDFEKTFLTRIRIRAEDQEANR